MPDWRIRRAWRASIGGLAVLAFFTCFVNVLKFAIPLYMLQMLDRVLASRSLETLIMLALITLCAVLAGVILESVRRRMLMRWGMWIERQFGPPLFLAAATARGQFSSPTQALRDLSAIRTFLSGPAPVAWIDLPFAALFVAVVYLLHPLLGMTLLAMLAVLLALAILHEVVTRRSRQESNDVAAEAQELVTTIERNRETVGALGMATNLAERWRQSAAAGLAARDRSHSATVALVASMRFLRRCIRIIGLGVGVWLVLEHALTLGGLIASGVMMRWAYSAVENAMRTWRSVLVAAGAYRRVRENLRLEPTVLPSMQTAESAPTLVLEDVGYRYAGKSESVFRRIAATVEPGEIFCVIGPSASGKSTLCRLITGLLVPRAGHVRLGDVDVGRLPADLRARLIGHLPQEVRLFQGSIGQNIARMGQVDFDEVVAAARLVGIHEMILRLPQGYDTPIADDAPSLSGGERKTIALARALYGRPGLIVLDEPEANLDRATRRQLAEALQTLRSWGKTIVVTSQTKALAKISDKVLILGGGTGELQETEAEPETETEAAVARRGTGRIRPVT
jgi:ATP-binding cassette, subfamily C, bacterial exporter for protease/lipase